MVPITARTGIIGLLGHPVEHSFSPEMQNAALAERGVNMCYLAFDVLPEDLKSAVRGLTSLGFVGFNATIPHKEAVMELVDEVDAEANLIGAVNTVVLREKRLMGYNTDGKGFVKSLQENGIDPSNKRIMILGAGGAAKAVAVALAFSGARSVQLANRTQVKAERIASLVEKTGIESNGLKLDSKSFYLELEKADIVVNATPVGMDTTETCLPFSDPRHIVSKTIVCDLIYNPRRTKLLQVAEEKGCRTVGGIGMLLHQGTEAFRLFTGVEPPVEIMRQSLNVVT